MARDLPRPRNLLRGPRLQPARLWLPAPPLPPVEPCMKNPFAMRTRRHSDRNILRHKPVANALAIVVLFAFLILSGCRAGAPPLNFPPGAMVLNLASISDVPTLDPAAGYDVESW